MCEKESGLKGVKRDLLASERPSERNVERLGFAFATEVGSSSRGCIITHQFAHSSSSIEPFRLTKAPAHPKIPYGNMVLEEYLGVKEGRQVYGANSMCLE